MIDRTRVTCSAFELASFPEHLLRLAPQRGLLARLRFGSRPAISLAKEGESIASDFPRLPGIRMLLGQNVECPRPKFRQDAGWVA